MSILLTQNNTCYSNTYTNAIVENGNSISLKGHEAKRMLKLNYITICSHFFTHHQL